MDEFYAKRHKKTFTKDAIIGLGEDSFRKNYYPELQGKIMDLERINARNRALMSTIPDILLVSNLRGDIVPFTFAVQKEDALDYVLMHNDKVMKILSEAVKEVAESNELLTKEFEIQKNGEYYYFEARLQKSEINEILIIIRNMTERILLERKLRELVEIDSLTKLNNRRNFEDKMHQYNGKTLDNITIITIDINGLKLINDTLGHLSGNHMIIAAAKVVRRIFGSFGHIARIGGDEFGIILDRIEENQVELLLGQMTERVHKYNTFIKNGGLSLAFGYSHHKHGIVNMELMFQEADNNMLQNKLLKKESIRSTFVKTLMKTLEVKDFVSEGHVMRMENNAILMGRELALHQDQMDKLVLLTKFHDIGKIGIPDAILKKPAILTDIEWNVMRTHTSIGERIALEAVEIKEIAHLILKHHENWDGTGYPLGLSGEEIPIECRILSIVDTFDAMTNDRPYRMALPAEKAIEEIKACSGTQFDPNLVELFLNIQHKM